MMRSHKTLIVCLAIIAIVACEAKTIKKEEKLGGRTGVAGNKKEEKTSGRTGVAGSKSGKTSAKGLNLWPFSAIYKCSEESTLDTDYQYDSDKKKHYDLKSWPNCGLNRFSPRPGELKLKRMARTFQDYLAQLEMSVEEARMSLKVTNAKNLKENTRIVGGKPVASGRWPWLAAVGKYEESPFCGATVIADRWLVTAAHCFKDEEEACKYTIRVGATEWLTDPEGLAQDAQVEAIYRHPGYDGDSHRNDIALLKLKDPLMLDADTNVNAICLPEKERSVKPGTLLYAAGWGRQGEGYSSTGSMEAMQVAVPLIGYAGCQCGEYPDELILEGMLCAGYKRGGKDTCQGDSGGPLIYKKDEKWYQLGATSFGIGCAEKGQPGVYTDVGQYLDWIASCMHRNRNS